MANTPDPNIYESTFAPSDKTDAILVVDGKKLHVNKTLLSCHSDYFKTLFTSDFAQKSMPEFPIKDVKFEDFVALLSLVHTKPILPTENNAETLLQLADRFLLPAAKSHVEVFLCSSQMDRFKKLELAGTYNLEVLLDKTVETFDKPEDFDYDSSIVFKLSLHVHNKLVSQSIKLFKQRTGFKLFPFNFCE